MMTKELVLLSYMRFQERAAGALANLAADDECSTEVAVAGGVHALVMLARNCKCEGVQEQVAIIFTVKTVSRMGILMCLGALHIQGCSFK